MFFNIVSVFCLVLSQNVTSCSKFGSCSVFSALPNFSSVNYITQQKDG